MHEIDKYISTFGISTNVNANPVAGWRVEARGHIIGDDGTALESIICDLVTSDANLIWEEYRVFVANNYLKAAKEIIREAYRLVNGTSRKLAVDNAFLAMLRGIAFGKRTPAK